MKNMKSPAVDAAKFVSERDGTHIIELPYGVRAKLCPVSSSLIEEVTNRLKDPEPPMWHNPDRDRDEPNPADPTYLREMADMERARGVAAIDAMLMFGLELLDPIPDAELWLKKLKFLERRGSLDLSGYDLEDDLDKEFLFKRFIASDNAVLKRITMMSGISAEDVEKAERQFQRDS